MNTKIYFDIDGVLADFYRSATKVIGALETPSAKIPQEKWKLIEKNKDFWTNLQEKSGTKRLLNFAKKLVGQENMFILSKVPSPNIFENPDYSKEAAKEKKLWVIKHFSDYFIPANILISFGSKAELITPCKDDILIDDRKSNIESWVEAKGTGILFYSVDQAIEYLKNYSNIR